MSRFATTQRKNQAGGGMPARVGLALGLLAVCTLPLGCRANKADGEGEGSMNATVTLPDPPHDSAVSLEAALRKRRSTRRFREDPLSLAQISQLLWAAQGVTEPARGLRTAPSAGATYPLETYLVVRHADGLETGVYRYDPEAHALRPLSATDASRPLAAAALGQTFVSEAAVNIVFSARYDRTRRYGDKTERFVHMEAGHASQNVYLQATALDLGTVVVGAFREERVRSLLQMPDEETPLYIQPVGPQ